MKTFKHAFASMALVGVFGLGLFMQSCSSSSNGPVSSTNDAVPMVGANNGIVAPDFAVPGLNDNVDVVALDPPRDGGGPIGKDTTIRDTSKGGREKDSGKARMRRLPIDCLGLDSAQMVQLRLLMEQAGLASRAANDEYRAAMAPIRAKDSAAMAAYREATRTTQAELKAMQARYRQLSSDIMAQVKSGAITRDDAKKQLADLRAQFEAESKDLRARMEAARAQLRTELASSAADRKAATDAYNARMKAIQDDLYAKIGGMLTPEQLIKWNMWLNGIDPCGKRPIK
ncbi:MAG: hypothetical protein ACKO9V_10475 [Candidatus Kapaibacterium sp.]